jgi:hypothetical protein
MPLVVNAVPGQRLSFRLSGKLAEPTTARWKAATADERKLYWPILAERLLVEWKGQMLAGRGRRGKLRRAKAISRLAYQQAGLGHRGAPLLPQREESRAWRLAKVVPFSDLGRVTGFWLGGWGRILSYHHTGTAGRGIPYFDDAGRIRWRGLPGQVTGIVRDLLPTATTIALAVASAAARWARLIKAGAPAPSAPAPKATDPLRPALAPTANRTYPATDHRSLGVAFRPSQRAKDNRHRTVLIDVRKFDRSWQGDADFAIPPRGGGAEIRGRRRGFLSFLLRALGRDTAIEVPEVYLNADGGAAINDGRHRFSVLRDLGLRYVPVTVSRRQAAQVAERFGYHGPLPAGEPGAPEAKRLLSRIRRWLRIEERRLEP